MFIMAEEKWLQPLAKTVSSMNRPPKVDATIGFPALFISLGSILSWKLLPQGSEPELARSPLPRAPRAPLLAPASHCPVLDLNI